MQRAVDSVCWGPDSAADVVVAANPIRPAEREARTIVIPNVKSATTRESMAQHIDFSQARLMTDGHSAYRRIREFMPHGVVEHDREYVRSDDPVIHTQGIENYWSLLKRGADRDVPPRGRGLPPTVSPRIRVPLQSAGSDGRGSLCASDGSDPGSADVVSGAPEPASRGRFGA